MELFERWFNILNCNIKIIARNGHLLNTVWGVTFEPTDGSLRKLVFRIPWGLFS